MMKRKKTKVLFVGSMNSIFIKELVERLKKTKNFEKLDGLMLTSPIKSFSTPVDTLYCHNIYYTDSLILKFFNKIKKYILNKATLHSLEKSYDIVNIHSMSPVIVMFWNDIKKVADKKVITFWGSDFYRASNKQKDSYVTILDECDHITFTSQSMMEIFLKYYKHYFNKCSVVSFGLQTLDNIKDNFPINKAQEKEYFSINNKITITIGYSAEERHRHLEIINQFISLSQEIQDNCMLLLPMTTGGEKYRNNIEDILKKHKINYKVFKEYLSYEDNAKLKIASDIMINVQKTDQFSGSMQEALFAQNLVITGSWLPYKIIDDLNVFILKVDDIESLSGTIKEAIELLDYKTNRLEKNTEIIWNLSNWTKQEKLWVELLEKVNEK